MSAVADPGSRPSAASRSSGLRALRRSAGIVIGATVGLLPWFEYQLRLKRPMATRQMRLLEDELVRLLDAEIGMLPAADVITVIATYRRPVQLQAAVASALAQTYDDHRVVVVDDGGGLHEPLPTDPRLSVIRLPRNVGVAGVVRNVAIRLSSSRLVAFLDDDNVWEPNHLAVAVAQHQEPVAVTYSQLRRVDGEGNLVDHLGAPFDRSVLRQRPLTDTNALVVRRDRHVRFSRVPRRREDFPAEDWELLWRLSRRGAVRFIPQVTVTYVQHGGSYYSVWGAA